MPRNRLPLIAAAGVGVLLIVLLRGVFSGKDEPSASGSSGGGSRQGCIALAVAASTEKSGLLTEIAKDYANAGHTVSGHCVDVRVSGKASGAAEEALARGWDDGLDGPRPDVWTPAASTWLGLLRQDLAAKDKPALLTAQNPSIASTPLVLAMPRPMAETLGWPKRPVGWSDLLALSRSTAGWGSKGHPEWGPFRLGKTNPLLSTSGLAATVGTFVAALGRSSDLTAADLAQKPVRRFVSDAERTVVHYGDTTLTFLANLQQADDAGRGMTYVSAVAVEEKSVLDYNAGNPSGDPGTAGKHPPPRVPLAAVYPKEGTLTSDNPYAVLDAPWVTAEKRAAAADFLSFVRSPAAQKRFGAAGFRDPAGKPGDAVRGSNALLGDQPKVVLSPPAPPVLVGVRQAWTQLRKRARVLLVLDVSGSMGEPVETAGGSAKLDLAKQAATQALKDFAPDDQVGVWSFSSAAGSPLYRSVAPIAPLGPALPKVRAAINGLFPAGGTPLYAVTRAAVNEVVARLDPNRINAVVVLTDGKNEYPQDTDLDGLVRSLQSSENVTESVRVFSIAYGEDADLNTLTKISKASRATAYDATDPARIERIFTAVVSNF